MENIMPFVAYNGEKKWETWREAFEIFSIAADLESMPLVRQRAILKHILGEKTMSIYKTFRVTENEAYPSIKEMLDMLSKHFKPFKNIIQIRNKFSTCVQKEGQGITEFVTELKQLAQECEFEELAESLIRDRFIIGMIDQEVKKKLLEDPQLTLPKAISVATIAKSVCLQIASWDEKQAMIEKINKNTWEKNRNRVEKAKAGPSISNTRNECKWCGQQHTYGNCPAYRKTCNACGKLNHFAAVCRTKRIRNLIAENEGDESFEGGINVNKVLVKTVRSDKWSAVRSINGNKTSVHLDTGDTCEKLEILKRINQINSHEMILHDETKKILEKFHEVFQGVGVINSECKMYTKPEYPPVRALPRRIPASPGNEVQSELEKMVKQGMITKIYHETEWSHPMVVVKKKSGQIRICLDPRKLNQALVRRHFQTPAPSELLYQIPKADYYTVLDVKSAYWHVPVANECRDLLVMATPFGKFRYNRLPFGLNISAQIFVEMITNIFKNSFWNVTYVVDLLIYADSIEEHNKKLKGILEISRRNNIKFDLTKAQICKKEVSFLGHMISKNGIDPEPNKVFWIVFADAFRMLTVAYGEATLDRSNVYRWYKMFSEGREDVNDEERAGRPSTSTTDEKINEVEKIILANRRITVREVAEDLNISIGSCHSIFINDLGMRRVAAKFVPKLLNCDQKLHRMNIANEMLDSVRDDPNLLQRVITGDEAWVYGYDVEIKAQSSQWKLPYEPRPKKARQVRSNVKVLLTVFFDCRGVVHHELLPQGRTVNKEYYLQVMRNLRKAIRLKRPDLWKK
ncbi:K02A2.6-like [Cordylochernes scorpioides]|uniref:K02A2.6-like n=1 Tax=Cordylochernes scorpioides TaxID=51811 RepID=A0ABY6K028_9ARAC|nr:K02A2.6-like [Cordylochernes scorpioides]